MNCKTLHCLMVTIMSVLCFEVRAQDRCDKILEGDLFNRVISGSSNQSASRMAIRSSLLNNSEDEAYEIYDREYNSGVSQGQSGSVGVNYFGIGGDADFQINYSRQLSRQEFVEKFRKAKRVYQQSFESFASGENSLATSYATYVRDSNTIEAWKTCITQERKMNIYAFGSRDGSGVPYVNVVWVPGELATTNPSIDIEFELPETIAIPSTTRTVAIGSGRTFRIDTSETDRYIQVTVNGEVKDHAGRHIRSLTSNAVVPPTESQLQSLEQEVPSSAIPPKAVTLNIMPNLMGQLAAPVIQLMACVSMESVEHCLNFLGQDTLNALGIDPKELAKFFHVTLKSGARPVVRGDSGRPGARIRFQAPAAGTPVEPLTEIIIDVR